MAMDLDPAPVRRDATGGNPARDDTARGNTARDDPARDDTVPAVFYDILGQTGLLAAGANVIMQLSLLPVGHGVARSRVDSGRVDRHPIKRLRTTVTYLAVALYGTDDDRDAMRRAVNRAHRQVYSLPEDPVPYNAFDTDLQLWVGACLYKGIEDIHEAIFGGPPTGAAADELYRHGAHLATTLQVKPSQWPADREAFAAYWAEGEAAIAMDDVTRPYLQRIARGTFLGPPWSWLVRNPLELVSVGFLPDRFKEELGLPWGRGRQRAFEAVVGASAAVDRTVPLALRRIPFDLYLRYFRWQVRTGRSVV